MPAVKTGLDVLLTSPDLLNQLKTARVGLVCNQTAVTGEGLVHAVDALRAAGVNLVRLFAPEHGVRATVQDMVGLEELTDPVSGLPVVSLYADTVESLKPKPESLEDLDIVLFDIQDIGTRFYTYQATLGFVMEVAGTVNTAVWVLDRPNPITGTAVEGNMVTPGFESFVGAYPIAIRHGCTVGELAGYFQRYCGVSCDTRVVRCEGWRRSMWFEETGLTFIFTSPNMPTVDAATVYPGMCFVEGTNLSEGRGTTRPFHWIGAPWLQPEALAQACKEGAERVGLEGVLFRPHAFLPGFQKHARTNCGGIEAHVTDRDRLNATLLGLVVIDAAYRVDPENFAWRTETYEFVSDPIAIDLLSGDVAYRSAVEAGRSLSTVLEGWEPARQLFLERRAQVLLYE